MKPAFVRTPGPVPATPPTPPTFATLLKQFREDAVLSQAGLARIAGFNASYISRLESDVRVPTRDAVQRLASAMQLTDVERTHLHLAAGFSPDEEAELLRKWARLSDTGKHAVRAVMAVALGEGGEA